MVFIKHTTSIVQKARLARMVVCTLSHKPKEVAQTTEVIQLLLDRVCTDMFGVLNVVNLDTQYNTKGPNDL